MQPTLELAGFFAAHGIWCVSDSGPLIPMLGQQQADGSKQMFRFAHDRLELGVEQGREALSENLDGAERAVLVYDGYIQLEAGKTDALFLEVESFAEPRQSFAIAVPYRNCDHADGFAVYRPKFLSIAGVAPDGAALAAAFFQGVESHEQGAAVWAEHLDESV